MKQLISKIRLFFWFVGGFISKYSKFALLSFLFGAISFIVYFRFSHLLPKRNNVQKIGLVARTTPERLPETIQTKISFGLTKISQDGKSFPNIVESWEVKEEGKSYVFHLKDGFVWHDGKPLKAEDINYNFKNVQFEALDEKTLRVKLDEPFSPLPALLSQPVLKRNYLGLGNWRVTNVQMRGGYLKSLLLVKTQDKNQLIRYQFYPSLEAAILGFKLGEVDILEDINRSTDFLNWPNLNLNASIAKDQFVAVYFFMRDDYLSYKELRLALAYSLENKENDGERAFGPLNPQSWAYNSQLKPYHFDLEAAREHFAKFKSESKFEGELTLELSTTLSQLKTAEAIKKSWEKLGIKVQIRVVSETPKEFQAFLASRQIPPDPDQYSLWHSTQESNLTRFQSPKVDKLLEDGRVEIDQEKRKEIYLDFQRFLVEECPAIFLFHPKVWTVSRKHL